MPFFPNSSLFFKNNARNISYMPPLIIKKCLDLRKNCYSQTTSKLAKKREKPLVPLISDTNGEDGSGRNKDYSKPGLLRCRAL